MDLFLSCDIEGCCGVTSWADADIRKGNTAAFAAAQLQMTRETAAACAGALDAGAARILVKDAHDTGRNLDLAALPEQVQVNRGWSGDLYGMMSGIQHGDWDAAAFVGYHSGASSAGSPLAHTLSTRVDYIEINGRRASEFTVSAYTAGLFGVPVCFVSGDAALCEQARRMIPRIACVPTCKGDGGSATCLHPAEAERRIHDALFTQLDSGVYRECLVTLPQEFEIFVRYLAEADAYRASFYPGAQLAEEKTIRFSCADFTEALRLFHFIL